MKKTKTCRLKKSGFSLIEMAIVLVILGLLLGGAMALIGPQREVQKVKDTEAEIQRIQEALIAFAINSPTGNLPCPNTNIGTPGLEGARVVATGDCQRFEGWVPFAVLGGIGRQDAWGNRFRYRVVKTYSRSNVAALPALNYSLATNLVTPAATSETLYVCSGNSVAPPCTVANNGIDVANNLVAVIVSYGRNGFGARNLESGILQTLPTGAHEIENTNGRNAADTLDGGNDANNRRFIYHVPSPIGAATGEFDDIVGWLPQGVFHSRLIAAGRLP